MAIPSWQTFCAPILQLAQDGNSHTPSEFEESAAVQLGLSAEDRTSMLASGSMTFVKDRTGWAYYALYRAGLLERPARGVYAITERGRNVLAKHRDRIDEKVLSEFPEFLEYRSKAASRKTPAEPASRDFGESADTTPQQAMDNAFRQLRNELAHQVLEAILTQSPNFFETLVVELLLKMGYGGSRTDAGQALGRTGDEGIDGVIKEDRLGLDVIYLQAKRWARENKVSRADVQGFVGSLAGKQAHKGVFITTSSFQDSARDYVKHLTQKVSLIDGLELAELCVEFNIGVTTEGVYTVKRLDNDFFQPE